jgi:predicted ATPase
VGKTALSLAVVAASSAHFPDGVFVVWLASLRSADLVAGEVAAQVGMQRSGSQSNEDALARWLADRDVLLMLDNCEHVVSAVAELVENLTARLPRLRVLATSREPLWLVDEVNYRLAPLPEVDAVGLFKERAGAAARASLDGERAGELVREICRRVDGLPLAIELAAARAVGLDLQDISRHLDHLFDLLPQAVRRADGEPRSLRATVEWSDALLTDDERLLLRRMAMFAGGFDLTAIEAVCASDGQTSAQIADLTARLVEKSLLSRQADIGAYLLLETIRQYSAEQLALAGELDMIRDRHARFHLEVGLREAEATQSGPETAHLEELRRIEGNTRVALDRLLTIDPEAVLALAANLNLFWWSQGKMREGRVWLERGREAARPHRTHRPSCGRRVFSAKPSCSPRTPMTGAPPPSSSTPGSRSPPPKQTNRRSSSPCCTASVRSATPFTEIRPLPSRAPRPPASSRRDTRARGVTPTACGNWGTLAARPARRPAPSRR